MNPPLIFLLDDAERDVGKERRKYAPLGSPGVSSDKLIFRQNPGFQKQKEQPAHLPVATATADSLHHLMMINMVETAFNIPFNNPWVREAVPFTVRLFP